MRPKDDIQKFFENAAISTNRQMDEKIFDKVLTAQEKAKQTKAPKAGAITWRTIIRSRMAKFAVAAAIIIAAVVGGYAGYEALTTEPIELPGGVTPLAQRIAETSLIVRGTLLEKEKELMEHGYKKIYWNVQIIRVLHGRAPHQVINVLACELPDDRRPSYVPTNEAGMEAILFLNKRDGQYRSAFVGFKPDDTKGMAKLDAREKEILEAVKGH